jgi:hypothetical protein
VRPAQHGVGLVDAAHQRQHPPCHVHIVARLAKASQIGRGRAPAGPPGADDLPIRRVPGALGFRPSSLVGSEQRQAGRSDHVTHRHAAPIAAMELKALDQTGVRESLEPALRCRDRAIRTEPQVQLAAEDVRESRDQLEQFDIAPVRLERRWGSRPSRPANRVREVELDELAIARSRGLGRRRRPRLPSYGIPRRRSDRCGGRRLKLGAGPLAIDRVRSGTLPVGLAQVGSVTSTAFALAGGVQRDALAIDAQRDRAGNERRLASLVGRPTRDRVMLGQMQARIRPAELRETVDAGTYRVGELGHRQADGAVAK